MDHPAAASRLLKIAVGNQLDGDAALYLGQANDLKVTVSAPEGVRLPAGATLALSFDGHLPDSAQPSSAGATGFTASLADPEVPTWTLTPVDPGQAMPRPLEIVLGGIVMPAAANHSTTGLTLGWKGLDGIEDNSRIATLVMEASPTPSLTDLHLTFAWCENPGATGAKAAVGEVQEIEITPSGEVPVENGFSLLIQNPDPSHAVVPAGGNVGKFTISFVTVPANDSPGALDALCAQWQLADARAGVEAGDSDWSVPASPTDDAWVLTPNNGNVLGAGESVVFTFSGLATTLPAFPTALHIAWNGISGHNDGFASLPMQKVPVEPAMLSFTAGLPDNGYIWAGCPVVLSWTSKGCKGAEAVFLYRQEPDGSRSLIHKGAPNDSFTVNPEAPTSWVAELRTATLPTRMCQMTSMQPVFASLVADPPGLHTSGAIITLTATAACYSSISMDPPWISFAPPGNAGGVGTYDHVVAMDASLGRNPPVTVTLTAQGYMGPVTATVVLRHVQPNVRFFMEPGDCMKQGDWLTTDDNSFAAILEADGNFCLYTGLGNWDEKRGWCTNTNVQTPPIDCFLILQPNDGNLCIYQGTGPPDFGFNIYNAKTNGLGGRLLMLDRYTGVLGLYTGTPENPGNVVWSRRPGDPPG